MLVGITGTPGSGRKTSLRYFATQDFKVVENNDDALESVVEKWRDDFVVLIDSVPGEVCKRPWFIHLHLEASDDVRAARSNISGLSGDLILQHRLENIRRAHINLINDFSTETELFRALKELNILDQERVRPSWDRYFMTIAELASQRSNCMKRRVGCVLVHENRIISTGYNGTPRGSKNCNEGGCIRCNSGSKGGTALATCLCLHAEENALLEAGRPRVSGATLYCNTCPCLTCSIKIVQTGVSEVIYSQDYSMDQVSARVLEDGGVKLRKYTGFI